MMIEMTVVIMLVIMMMMMKMMMMMMKMMMKMMMMMMMMMMMLLIVILLAMIMEKNYLKDKNKRSITPINIIYFLSNIFGISRWLSYLVDNLAPLYVGNVSLKTSDNAENRIEKICNLLGLLLFDQHTEWSLSLDVEC